MVAAVRLPESRYDPADPFGELTSLADHPSPGLLGQRPVSYNHLTLPTILRVLISVVSVALTQNTPTSMYLIEYTYIYIND